MSVDNQASIEKISLQDVDELVENFCFPWDTRDKTEAKWKRYFEEHQKEIRTVAVVKSRNEIVGYGSLLYKSEYPFFADVPEISDVWLHEKYRGIGLGTALIQWFETLAKKKGCKEVGIGVGLYTDYGRAQRLYIKLGYVPDGNGITYKCKKTTPGTSYPLDDDLILWLKKPLKHVSA